jgi:hypothetical protein
MLVTAALLLAVLLLPYVCANAILSSPLLVAVVFPVAIVTRDKAMTVYTAVYIHPSFKYNIS